MNPNISLNTRTPRWKIFKTKQKKKLKNQNVHANQPNKGREHRQTEKKAYELTDDRNNRWRRREAGEEGRRRRRGRILIRWSVEQEKPGQASLARIKSGVFTSFHLASPLRVWDKISAKSSWAKLTLAKPIPRPISWPEAHCCFGNMYV